MASIRSVVYGGRIISSSMFKMYTSSHSMLHAVNEVPTKNGTGECNTSNMVLGRIGTKVDYRYALEHNTHVYINVPAICTVTTLIKRQW